MEQRGAFFNGQAEDAAAMRVLPLGRAKLRLHGPWAGWNSDFPSYHLGVGMPLSHLLPKHLLSTHCVPGILSTSD